MFGVNVAINNINFIGAVPSTLCDLSLTSISLSSNHLTCAPSCLNSISYFYSSYYGGSNGDVSVCPSIQDKGLCGIVASTNVGSIYSEWSCNTLGIPLTNPCNVTSMWPMLSCDYDEVVGISNFSGFTGSLPSSVNLLYGLRELDVHGNDFISGEKY